MKPKMHIIETGYQPRHLQAVLHAKLKRFNVLVMHRRFGKTVFSVNEMLDQAFRNGRNNPQYAFIAPTYGQAERIAWDMLKTYTRMIPGVTYNEQKLTCRIPRSSGDQIKIMLLGAENPDSIRGIYLDGAVLDEFAEMDPRVWGQVVRPALSDRKGWAIFIGTPKGQNHFYDVYKKALELGAEENSGWFSKVYKASETGVLPVEELIAMRQEMTTDEEYEQELECSFTAALIGSYYGKIIADLRQKGRVGQVPHDQALQVDTFWDLGISDTTAIWFVQQYRQEVRLIDYMEMSGEGLEYYARALKEGHRAKYNYRHHEWPHDGAARDLSTGQERNVTMRGLGVAVRVNKKHSLQDQIDAARRLLARCYIDEKLCQRGLDSLINYQKKYDSKNKIFMDQPLHNWASHGASAFQLGGMVLRPGDDRQGRVLPRSAEKDYDIFGV